MELEKMYEMYEGKVNSPTTFLANGISETDTEIEVTDITCLPKAPNLACLGRETAIETTLYESAEGNVLKGCIRGFQGEAKEWARLTPVERSFAEYDLGSIQRNVKALNNNKPDITELVQAALSGNYNDLTNKPESLPANGGNADTANDLRNAGAAVTKENIFANPPLNTMGGLSRYSFILSAEEAREYGSPLVSGGSEYWEVLTFAQAPARALQMAMQVYRQTHQAVPYLRARHMDNNDYSQWQEWIRLYSNNTSIVPKNDNAYDVGSASLRFRQIVAANSTIVTSDEREKEKIKPLDGKTVDFIMSLNPVEYELKGEEYLRTHYGLIAQEVEKALYDNGMNSLDFAGLIISPITEEVQSAEFNEQNEPVTKTVITGERYGLRYEEFISPLIKTVQEQQKRIEALEKRIAELEKQNT